MLIQIVFFIIFAAFIIAMMVVGFYAATKRRKELFAWAFSRDFTFSPAKIYRFESQFPQFKCFQTGRNKYAYNIIEGVLNNRRFIGFDYHYTTGSGKDQQEHYFSGIILQSEILLKPLSIRPENFLDKIGEFAGFNDIAL